jgi:hypothetical protein
MEILGRLRSSPDTRRKGASRETEFKNSLAVGKKTGLLTT